ncbi:MAG: protein kinase, partial [Myxococcota bacterium]
MAVWDNNDTLPIQSGAFALDLDEWPERTLSSRYVEEKLLGQGGMGEVWQAWDRELRRRVAIKRVRIDADTALDARLVREARITAGLEHPGIVSVHDAGTDDEGRPWYAMQLVRGRTLAEHLKEPTDADSRQRLLRHALAACEAVGFAHHAGVVHRDLKPDNIQVGAFGETQVLDWGLARPQNEDDGWDEVLTQLGTLTEAGLILGTPAYMSPEQAAGGTSGPEGDVWSLGVVLYEVVAGRPAYSGRSSQEVLRQVLAGPPPSLMDQPIDASPELLAIIERALQLLPADRYPNAHALAQDLSAYLDGHRVSAHTYTAMDELKRVARQWRVPLIAASACTLGLVAAGGFGGWNLWQNQQRLEGVQHELEDAAAAVDERLGEALSQRALLAFRDGDLARAQLLAANALEKREDPDARGILADASPHPRLLNRVAVDACGHGQLSASGLVCASAAGVQLIDEDGAQRWISRISGLRVWAQPWQDSVMVGSGSDVLTAFDVATISGVPIRYQRTARLSHDGTSNVQGRFISHDEHLVRMVGPDATPSSTVDDTPCPGTRISDVGLLSENDLLVWCRGGVIRRGPAGSTLPILTIDGDHTPDSHALAATGRRAAYGEITGQVRVLDLVRAEQVFSLSLGPSRVDQVALSADGRWLAAHMPGAGLHVIDVDGDRRYVLPGRVRDIAFDAQGRLRVHTAEGLDIWDIPTTEAYSALSMGSPGVVGLSWGEQLSVASGCIAGRLNPEKRARNLETSPNLDRIKWASSLDNERMLIGTLHGAFVHSKAGLQRLARSGATRRALPMEGGHMLMLGTPTWLWRVEDGKDLLYDPLLYSKEGSISPDGRVAALMSDRGTLHRLELGEPISWTSLGEHAATAVAPGPKGWPVYLGTLDGIHTLDDAGRRTRWVRTDTKITDLAVSNHSD